MFYYKHILCTVTNLNGELTELNSKCIAKRINADTWGYRTGASVVLIQTRIINANGDYVRLISISEIQELLQEIDPDVVVNADRFQSQGIITTWNSDEDVALTHFYAPELSRNYGYVYQYFYPNRVGDMRILLRIEYPVI